MSKWSSLSSPFFILYQQLRTEATPKIIVIFRNRKPQPHAVLAIRPGGSCAITLRNRGIYAVAQLHITITGLLTSSRITAQDRPKVNTFPFPLFLRTEMVLSPRQYLFLIATTSIYRITATTRNVTAVGVSEIRLTTT